ncbi:hypothetical protein JL720_3425 [Aureococcus anophagefferens]|nr:hypothetical protein JL720_3425 [Aureococcus anophagefferens]
MMRRASSRLILLRHGQSEWNGASGFGPARFTGWVDVALTPRGEAEAAAAGALLRSQAPPMAGVRKDDPGLLATPLAHSTQTKKPLTASELEKIRRSMREAPPAMSASHPHYDAKAPPTESLADCQRRVLACFDERVAPAVRGGRTVLVAAHANTLRALIAALDGVPDALVPKIFVPNAVPCVLSRRPTSFEDRAKSPRRRSTRSTATRSRPSRRGSNRRAAGRTRWLLSAENYERLAEKIGVSTLARNIFEA